jgi:alanine racemase
MLVHSDIRLKIDLGKIADNYRILVEKSGNAKCAAVVKANAYGIGVIPVSKKLYSVGCRDFFVATLDEAIELRQELLSNDANIYIFNGIREGQEKYFVENNLVPILNNLQEVVVWSEYSRINSKNLPAIIHIDTGMQRLGMRFADFMQSASRLANLDIKLVISHLSCADDTNHEMNARQLELFEEVQLLFSQYKYSIANSAGIFLGEDYHFDLTRPGCALYGVNPNNEKINPMNNVVSLQAPIIDIRAVEAGNSIGYGAAYIVNRNSIIATIPVGYADGYLRCLGNKSYCYIGENRIPVVGIVSMDLITLDVTDVPEADLGVMVEVIGDNVTINDLAQWAGTIGYEIITSLGNRYHCEYIG